MPLTINGKTFMNLQEAVAWLLANNALPFQSTASFAPDTEIAKSTIINPSPAEIKIGSLVLFADGKVGTVSAITSNGFKVGQDATDLADGVPHITNVQINASGHLIITMSEGDPIDAGLIKEVSSMTIDASQHLIVTYNDGSSTDLGAIFQGNVNIAGNLTADSIIENMSGYSATIGRTANFDYEKVYFGAVKNGNKITFVLALNLTKRSGGTFNPILGEITIPSAVGAQLYPTELDGYYFLDNRVLNIFKNNAVSVEAPAYIQKLSNTVIQFRISDSANMVEDQKYYVRYEATFLLSDDIA